MASNFDLNLLAQNEEIEVLFNLNEIPPTEESFNNGYGDCSIDPVQNEETEVLLDLNEVPPTEENFNNGHGDCSLDPDHEDTIQDAQNPPRTYKYLSDDERHEIFCALLAKSIGGKLGKNVTREISHQFSVPIFTVQRIWKRAKETTNGGRVDVSSRRTGNCGRKRISLEPSQVAAVPLHKRTALRSMSMAMNVSCTTLFRRKKEGFIRQHTNSIRPHLKEDNMKGRLQFCISMLDESTLSYEPKFVDMYNIVHIDEKWFYMTRKPEKYYLLPAEDEPLRTCQSKNYIGKVMFLAAMARPRFDEEGKEEFSGKIGVFPFVTMEPAKRRSKNRDAGTLECKALTSIKREDIKAFLIGKVIPAIHEKWPKEDQRKIIFIQQDNARTHVECGDKDFQEAASKNGFNIQLMCQPPNSPDLNILDLGFFSAIQSLQYKECPKTIEDLVVAVEKSFDQYSTKKVNSIFLTLQSCMQEIMKAGGSNKYKIPHMRKSVLESDNCLPRQLNCDVTVVQNAMRILGSLD